MPGETLTQTVSMQSVRIARVPGGILRLDHERHREVVSIG
jgi:hypothetical protein